MSRVRVRMPFSSLKYITPPPPYSVLHIVYSTSVFLLTYNFFFTVLTLCMAWLVVAARSYKPQWIRSSIRSLIFEAMGTKCRKCSKCHRNSVHSWAQAQYLDPGKKWYSGVSVLKKSVLFCFRFDSCVKQSWKSGLGPYVLWTPAPLVGLGFVYRLSQIFTFSKWHHSSQGNHQAAVWRHLTWWMI